MPDINPSEFFNIDAVEDDAPQQEDNVYAELEQTLNLPIGSTQDALTASNELIQKTKALTAQADIVNSMTTSIDTRDAEDIDDDLLRKDRARIRKEAHELYDMGRNLLNDMYSQVKSLYEPNDKMWAAVSSMIASVSKSLGDLNKMTKEFRQEYDRDVEKKIQSGQIDVTDQEFEFSPDQANRIIASWTKESEGKIPSTVQKEVEERDAKRIGMDVPQIEHKE